MEVSKRVSFNQKSFDTIRVVHETILALHNFVRTLPKEMDEEVNTNVTKEEDEDDDDDVFHAVVAHQTKQDSEEDIDDIELVFTTGTETDPRALNEELVSIKDERRKTLHTVIVEDISKCGVEGDLDPSRRNTLPNIIPYRPIPHREILGLTKIRGPIRPVHKQEAGAQTDLTALPEHSKSETYLARKISSTLTTLPSKFTLPVPSAKQLPVNDKTTEARRVLLSDINFTSMVPELSRSVDHLPKEEDDQVRRLGKNYPGAVEYMKRYDSYHYQERPRCSRSSWSSYCGSRYQSILFPCNEDEIPQRRHSWRPPLNTPCCHVQTFWSSMPGSPSHCSRIPSSTEYQSSVRRLPYHHHICYAHVHPGHSLPDLRDMESSDSTDSLIDEAEDYLRRHIDSVVGKRNSGTSQQRWKSDANIAFGKNYKSGQPFIPRTEHDLKSGDVAKVIAAESRVVIGVVRYCGSIEGKNEPFVGVELPGNTGVSDGTFCGHRYFQCKQDHAIFVPFKKVVIAWSH